MNELQKKLDQLLGDMKAIQDGYKPDEAFSSEDLTKFQKMAADADSIQKTIDATSKANGIAKAAEKVDELPLAGVVKSDQRELVKAWAAMIIDPANHEAKEAYRAITKSAQAGNPAQGGAGVVPLAIAQEIVRLGEDSTFIRNYAKTTTILQAASLGVVRMDELSSNFNWSNENAAATEKTVSTDRRELSPHRLTGYVDISRRLLSLAPNMEAEIVSKIRYHVAETEERAFLQGTGTGQPLGCMVVNAQGVTSSRVVTTAATDTIAYKDLVSVLAKSKPKMRPGGMWVFGPNTEAVLFGLIDDVKRPLLQVGFSGIENRLGLTILGYPFMTSEFAPADTFGTANGSLTSDTYPVLFANFAMGYHIADALDVEIDADPYTRAANYETRLTVHKHTDGMPVNEEAFVLLKVQ